MDCYLANCLLRKTKTEFSNEEWNPQLTHYRLSTGQTSSQHVEDPSPVDSQATHSEREKQNFPEAESSGSFLTHQGVGTGSLKRIQGTLLHCPPSPLGAPQQHRVFVYPNYLRRWRERGAADKAAGQVTASLTLLTPTFLPLII